MRAILAAALLTLIALAGLTGAMAAPPAPVQSATLPPTWTPTFTRTPTVTPSPTLTPTVTPTLTIQQACDRFQANALQPERRYYPYDQALSIIFSTDVRGVTAQFFAEHRLSGVGVGILSIERVDFNTVNIPMSALPRHGLYDWRIDLLDSDENVLCTRGGLFVAGFPITATPPPPSGTPTPTPIVIIVTATPTPDSD